MLQNSNERRWNLLLVYWFCHAFFEMVEITYAYNEGMAHEAKEKRMQAKFQNGVMQNNMRANAGMN